MSKEPVEYLRHIPGECVYLISVTKDLPAIVCDKSLTKK